MKNTVLIFTALFLLFFSVSADTKSADMARIHVVANSDSEEDIEVKMKIADEIFRILKNEKFDSIESIEKGLKKRICEIERRSRDILTENGFNYGVKAEIGIRSFDKKSLGNSSFHEGEYTALVVTLGEGKGHNWWSVLFPDLSFEASLAIGEDGRYGKTVITNGGGVVKFRCLLFDICKFLVDKA